MAQQALDALEGCRGFLGRKQIVESLAQGSGIR
jgi:hypothetical protein